MISRVVRVVIVLCIAAAAAVAGTTIINAAQRQSVTSTYSMQVGGLTRSWEEVVPVAPLPKSAPVIVVLSGIAAPVSNEIARDHLVPYVNTGEAELVYPVGYQESWNAGGCCGHAAAQNVDDVAFLEALAARVDPGHQHPLDLVGYSNGGRMAYRMACSSPGIYDQTAVVKAMPMPGCVVTKPQTFLQVAALNDYAVAYAPGDTGKETPQATVEIARLRSADRCTAPPVTKTRGQLKLTTYGGCADGTRLGFAVYSSGGHSFPQPSTTAPSGAAVIWAFFTGGKIAPLPA